MKKLSILFIAGMLFSGSLWASGLNPINGEMICKIPSGNNILAALFGEKVSVYLSNPAPVSSDSIELTAKVDMPVRLRGLYKAVVDFDRDGVAERMIIVIPRENSKLEVNLRSMQASFQNERIDQDGMSCLIK